MDDRIEFQKRMEETMDIAHAQDDKIGVRKIRDIFEDMNLKDDQYNRIIEYLIANHIDIEGYAGTDLDNTAKTVPHNRVYQPKSINTRDSAYLSQYLEELHNIKEATEEEKLQLISRLSQGDYAAKDRFIEIHLHDIVTIASEFSSQGLTMEDLIQEGNMALLQALENIREDLDPENVWKDIHTYVRDWIQTALKEQQENDDLENTVLEKSNHLFVALKELEEELGRKANIRELVEYTRITEEEIRKVMDLSADALELEHVH